MIASTVRPRARTRCTTALPRPPPRPARCEHPRRAEVERRTRQPSMGGGDPPTRCPALWNACLEYAGGYGAQFKHIGCPVPIDSARPPPARPTRQVPRHRHRSRAAIPRRPIQLVDQPVHRRTAIDPQQPLDAPHSLARVPGLRATIGRSGGSDSPDGSVAQRLFASKRGTRFLVGRPLAPGAPSAQAPKIS